MKTKTHRNKLQKSSGIFLPLGLVLTLLMVYFLLESKTAVANNTDFEFSNQSSDHIEYVDQKEIRIERKQTKQVKKIIDKKTLDVRDTFTKSEDDLVKETESLFENEEPIVENIDDSNEFVELPDEPIVEDVEFMFIEDAPVFPGCEKKKSKEDKKACFTKKMNRFISRKFNSNLAGKLGLSPGKQKIFVQFIITKTGKIEIVNARAPHARLEAEGKRIINQLPLMVPGKQRGRAVNVRYMQPISFNVE